MTADVDPYPSGSDDTNAETTGGATPESSWPARVGILVAIGVLALLIVMHLLFGGGFGGLH